MTSFPFFDVCRSGSRHTACGGGGTGISTRAFRRQSGPMPLVGVLAVWISIFGCAAGQGQLPADSPEAAPTGPNVLESVGVAPEGDATVITLTGRRPLQYTLFPATDPDRVLVYLQNTEVGSLEIPDPLDQGGVHRVYSEVIEEGGSSLTRMVIELAEPLSHRVREEGRDLKVVLERSEVDPQPVVAETVQASTDETTEDSGLAGPTRLDPQIERWEESGVVEEYGAPMTRITVKGVVGEGGYRYFRLENPSRLVVDVLGPSLDPLFERLPLKGNAFEQIRVGRYPEKVRFVLDARHERGEAAVRAEGSDLVIQVGEIRPPAAVAPMLAGGPGPAVQAGAEPWKPVLVTGIDFVKTSDSSQVVVTTQGKAVFDVEETEDGIRLVLPGAAVAASLLRPLDTSASETAVVGVFPEQTGSGPAGEARIRVRMREKLPYHVQQEDGTLRLTIQLPPKKPEAPAVAAAAAPSAATPDMAGKPAPKPPRPQEPAREMDTSPKAERESAEKPASPAGPGPAAAVAATPRPPLPPAQYTGRKISLDFKDADIQNVLRLIAEVSGKNIVISEAVQGKVTIRLMQVPWDMALDVILKTYALDKEELGPDILRVAPYSQLKKEREEALKADEARENVEPLVMEIVPVNYARAKDLESLLGRFKSKRNDAGILVDTRTNSLILRDLPANVQEMVKVIRDLDTQTPQVLIEAKIVELNVDFERELGIQWGTLYRAGPATGNPTGMNFPHTVDIGGAASNVSGAPVPGITNPVVNLPAAIDSNAGGALGLSLGSLTKSFQLDMQLSALEKEKKARVLSSPRVATLNNQEARIEQGQEVPYQTTSDEGTKTEFKDAKLRLSVTPQITFDRSIVMNIVVSNDTPIKDPTVGFIIQKKEAQTSVLVKDAETAVIGGIFTNNESETVGGVPWFKDLPGVGSVFRKKGRADIRTELIIFITPRIIPIKQEKAGQWIE